MANKDITELEELQWKRTKTYKYLGVWITTKGSAIHHYKKTIGQILKTAWRLRGLNKILPMRHIVRLWHVFAKPYFDYISTILWMQKKAMIQKYETLWRKVIKIICGLHRGFSVEVLETIFGQIPYYGGTDCFLYQQWKIVLTRKMWKGYEEYYVKRIQESKQDVKEWGFKDVEQMDKYTDENLWFQDEYTKNRYLMYGMSEDTRYNRNPHFSKIQALVRRKQKLEMELDKKMKKYEDNHKDLLQKQGKQLHQKIDTNRVRKVANYGYFDQLRYSNVRCKKHPHLWLNREHVLEHLVQGWPNGIKWVKELEEINEWVLAPTNFGKKCAEKKNNIMKYVSNKIRQVIEQHGVFFQKKKKIN